MMKIADIYVSISEYLLRDIDFNWWRGNIQLSMLDLPVFNDILIYTYYHEIFPTFLWANGVYIICLLSLVKVEVMSNIQCQLSTSKTLLQNKTPKILQMLASLVILNIFGAWCRYWRYIQKIYFSFFNFLLKNIMMKIAEIYIIINEYLLQEIHINWWRENSQHSMLDIRVFIVISIYTYQQEILMTFMLVNVIYIAPSIELSKGGIIRQN